MKMLFLKTKHQQICIEAEFLFDKKMLLTHLLSKDLDFWT